MIALSDAVVASSIGAFSVICVALITVIIPMRFKKASEVEGAEAYNDRELSKAALEARDDLIREFIKRMAEQQQEIDLWRSRYTEMAPEETGT